MFEREGMRRIRLGTWGWKPSGNGKDNLKKMEMGADTREKRQKTGKLLGNEK